MGSKDLTKQFMIERKDNEKKLKKAIAHTETKLEKKVHRVEAAIDPAIAKLEKKVDGHYADLDTRILGAKENIEETNKSIANFQELVDTLERDFALVKKEYKESQDLLACNIRKMGRDKRTLTERLVANFDLLSSAEL